MPIGNFPTVSQPNFWNLETNQVMDFGVYFPFLLEITVSSR